jgi:translation initiation factor eIF-2B subunit delta
MRTFSHFHFLLLFLSELPDPHSVELTSTLHPAVIELGMQYASGEIRGGNARCRAMLQVFVQVLDDYQPPADIADYRSHLDHFVFKPSFTYWTTRCRPHSVSMGNAFTFAKMAVASLGREMPWAEAKEILQETMERYLQERLDYADRAIAEHARRKIEDGDVILTFGNSQVISVLLTMAKEENINFYVWVVDARPLWEGKQMLETLRAADIPCGYIQLNALTYVMQQVTKVLLGASALMSNGSIYGRIGTACVALMAKDKHIPVLVCCETYKISNKVQLESITQNELGNPDSLIHGESLKNWKETPNLKLLNLLYDVTPPEFVSGIVTEAGIIPPTSVAVLLREMNPQDAAY